MMHEINLDKEPFDAMWEELNYSVIGKAGIDYRVDDLIHVKEIDMPWEYPSMNSTREMIAQIMYIMKGANVLSVVVLKRVEPSFKIFPKEMMFA